MYYQTFKQIDMDTEINNGIKSFLGLGIYFLTIEFLGLTHTTFLRMLNIFIVGYFMHKSITQRVMEGRNFLTLFGSAFFTNLIAVLLSTIALSGYIYFLRGAEHISTLSQPLLSIGHFKLSVGQFSFAIFAEGLSSGVIMSFVFMQYWKNKTKKSISFNKQN